MTSRDFAYWLQGFFELSDTKTINPQQTKMLKNHLAMALHYKKSQDKSFPVKQSDEFVDWLRDLFVFRDCPTLNEKQTALIQKRLSTVFLHEIDPSFGEGKIQEELNQLYQAIESALPDNLKVPPHLNPDNDGETLYRC